MTHRIVTTFPDKERENLQQFVTACECKNISNCTLVVDRANLLASVRYNCLDVNIHTSILSFSLSASSLQSYLLPRHPQDWPGAEGPLGVPLVIGINRT